MADWEAVSRSEDFDLLVARRRRFMIPALIVWAAWFGAFLVCCGYARGFMGKSIYEGFTVAYAWALSIIVLTWAIGWLYVRISARSIDPLAERVTAGADRETFADRPAPGREPVADRIAARR
jgi:uncharacterized membrane protein (DUF485 family)